MTDDLVQIIYVSSATQLMNEEELAGLLRQSRISNSKRDVTGMLVYDDGNFIQVLEGEEAVLDGLLDIIHRDPRHKGVIEVNREQVERREFPEWSMGFRYAGEIDEPGLSDIMKLTRQERLERFAQEGMAKSLFASQISL